MPPAKKTTAKSATAKKTAKKATKTSTKKKAPKVTQEQIRARAYELYEKSGHQDGSDLEHWIQAEKELLAK